MSNLRLKMELRVEECILKVSKRIAKQFKKNDGFGLSEVLAAVGALVVVALVLIPGLKTFGGTVLTKINSWWTTIQTTIFA